MSKFLNRMLATSAAILALSNGAGASSWFLEDDAKKVATRSDDFEEILNAKLYANVSTKPSAEDQNFLAAYKKEMQDLENFRTQLVAKEAELAAQKIKVDEAQLALTQFNAEKFENEKPEDEIKTDLDAKIAEANSTLYALDVTSTNLDKKQDFIANSAILKRSKKQLLQHFTDAFEEDAAKFVKASYLLNENKKSLSYTKELAEKGALKIDGVDLDISAVSDEVAANHALKMNDVLGDVRPKKDVIEAQLNDLQVELNAYIKALEAHNQEDEKRNKIAETLQKTLEQEEKKYTDLQTEKNQLTADIQALENSFTEDRKNRKAVIENSLLNPDLKATMEILSATSSKIIKEKDAEAAENEKSASDLIELLTGVNITGKSVFGVTGLVTVLDDIANVAEDEARNDQINRLKDTVRKNLGVEAAAGGDAGTPVVNVEETDAYKTLAGQNKDLQAELVAKSNKVTALEAQLDEVNNDLIAADNSLTILKRFFDRMGVSEDITKKLFALTDPDDINALIDPSKPEIKKFILMMNNLALPKGGKPDPKPTGGKPGPKPTGGKSDPKPTGGNPGPKPTPKEEVSAELKSYLSSNIANVVNVDHVNKTYGFTSDAMAFGLTNEITQVMNKFGYKAV